MNQLFPAVLCRVVLLHQANMAIDPAALLPSKIAAPGTRRQTRPVVADLNEPAHVQPLHNVVKVTFICFVCHVCFTCFSKYSLCCSLSVCLSVCLTLSCNWSDISQVSSHFSAALLLNVEVQYSQKLSSSKPIKHDSKMSKVCVHFEFTQIVTLLHKMCIVDFQ